MLVTQASVNYKIIVNKIKGYQNVEQTQDKFVKDSSTRLRILLKVSPPL